MNIWLRCTEKNKDFLALGDMNLGALSWNKTACYHSSLANIVQDFMLSENCHQLISEYTRIRSVGGVIQRSCLDHITTNCVSKVSSAEVVGLSKSDHLGVSVIKSSKEIRTSPKTTKNRIYKNFSKAEFLNDVNEAKKQGMFEEMFDHEDIDKATEIFTTAFNQVLDRHAPIKIIQNRTNYLPYISKEIDKVQKSRDDLKLEAAKTGDLDIYDKYKTERNKVTYMLRSAEKDYLDNKFNDEESSCSDMWKTAYSVLGSFRSSFPSQVMIFGKLVTKPILLATGMNEFFIQKIADLKANDIPNIDNEVSNDVLKEFLSSKTIPNEGFNLKEITSLEMMKLIKGLKGKKSCGLDWICGFSLKIAATELLDELMFLTNLSIRTTGFLLNGNIQKYYQASKIKDQDMKQSFIIQYKIFRRFIN